MALSAVGLVTGVAVAFAVVREPAPTPVTAAVEAAPPTTTTTTTTAAKPVPEPVAEIVAAFPGEAGLAVFDLRAGVMATGHGADKAFTSASLVKLLIAFEAVRVGRWAPDVARMLSRSDDAVASALWLELDGERLVRSWARTLGLAGTAPPRDPLRWGDTATTAHDVVLVYRHLLASPALRERVLPALREATETGSDGFPQLFGIPRAARDWAVKQGWSCCGPGRTLHTTGLVSGRFVVAVLTTQPKAVGWDEARANVTALTRELVNHYAATETSD